MKYYVTFSDDGYWDTAVEADSLEKAKTVAENEFDYADFVKLLQPKAKLFKLLTAKAT